MADWLHGNNSLLKIKLSRTLLIYSVLLCFSEKCLDAAKGEMERELSRFTRTLLIVCGALLTVACGNKDVQELTSLVDWNPEYTKNWAPSLGATLPALSVKDVSGKTLNFDDLTGEKGLLIFFVRSTNW